MASIGEVAVAITLLVLTVQGFLVLGRLECEKLPIEFCAFSVSSSGARCVLEKEYSLFDRSIYNCKSSAIMAEKRREWIESEKCLRICGLQRMSVGMSIDDINEYSEFSSKLCSDKCQSSCPNVADLYPTLTSNGGLYLPHLCEVHDKRSRRLVLQNESGSGSDVDNEHEDMLVAAPTPSPMMINALTPSPTMNVPMFGPTPAIIDALTPAPTMGVD
ncbi:hypothetical protein SUGI_0775570 [Cryptomeria japonica]|uniref:uncharacterized protein LOC131074574 n=1 Tax=Cryptomeria japonica TaxID=3369 RepID=UPI002414B6C2|nr:uncharacterized protein LOC131074574 [Cryptomeria japonica]GLJ38099.1 hypothetical protein SUGI_0775570 [Cryptomeria japonica]